MIDERSQGQHSILWLVLTGPPRPVFGKMTSRYQEKTDWIKIALAYSAGEILTYWPLGNTTVIFKLISGIDLLNIFFNCPCVNGTRPRWWIVNISASNVDPDLCCHWVSLVHNELTWWRHQIETFSALLAISAGNSPVPVNFPHKGQWRGALMFSLICARISGWLNNGEAGDLRRYRAHCDVIVMNYVIIRRWTEWSTVSVFFPRRRKIFGHFE